jgi:hypothetical protein
LDHKINVFVDISKFFLKTNKSSNFFFFELRFADHKTDFAEIPTERPILISCRQSGCRCVSFEYVANASGTSDPNCRCKHSLDNHGTKPPYKCQKSI